MAPMLRKIRRIARGLLLAVAPPVTIQGLLLKRRYPRRDAAPRETGDPGIDRILAQVRECGLAVIPDYLTAEECLQAIREFEAATSSYPGFVHFAEDKRLYGLELASPIARHFYSDPLWARLAEAYMLEPPVGICVMANRIDADGTAKLGSGGCWHRDGFARELKVILYLTDVTEETGPFQYIKASHRMILSDMKEGKIGLLQNRIRDGSVGRLLDCDPDRLATVVAPAGAAIVLDDSGIHRGAPIRSGRRYAMTSYMCARSAIEPGVFANYTPMLSAGALRPKNS